MHPKTALAIVALLALMPATRVSGQGEAPQPDPVVAETGEQGRHDREAGASAAKGQGGLITMHHVLPP